MHIRESQTSDLPDILKIHSLAFGHDKEANLVNEMLEDPTSNPMLSLMAFDEDNPVGHVLFTHVKIIGTNKACVATILAPLAVVPEVQGKGAGSLLINDGLRRLSESNIELVFVLGHPGYYPRFGFEPAGRLGLDAPYPIPEEHAEAWMVQALRQGVVGEVQGTVKCSDALNNPAHWRE